MSDLADKSPSRSNKIFPFFVVIMMVLGVFLFMKFFVIKIDPGYQGVVSKMGNPPSEVLDSGYHIKINPLSHVDLVQINNDVILPVGYEEVQGKILLTDEGYYISDEGKLVGIALKVNYKVSNGKNFTETYSDPIELLGLEIPLLVREMVRETAFDSIMLDTSFEDHLRIFLDTEIQAFNLGLNINNVYIQKLVDFSKERSALDEIAQAKYDSQLIVEGAYPYQDSVMSEARNQAVKKIEQAKAYASLKINQAKGDSARFASVLKQYKKSREVTRKTLYLETMEEILPKVKKIIVEDSPTANTLSAGEF